MSAGVCRFCRCTEEKPSKLPPGYEWGWHTETRDVCNAPWCVKRYRRWLKEEAAKDHARFRKRTPGQIYALKMEEKRRKQRAYRAECRERKKRGAP